MFFTIYIFFTKRYCFPFHLYSNNLLRKQDRYLFERIIKIIRVLS